MVASTFHVVIGPSKKIIYVSYVPGGCMWVHWHGPINVISDYFKDCHFEFRVNRELTKGHMDCSVSSLGSSSRKTWGGRRSPAVACWASDHWVASSNPLRGKFRH